MSELAFAPKIIKSDRNEIVRAQKLDLRLGIITGSLAARDENGNMILSFALGRLLEAIRERVPETRVCIPILPQPRHDMNHVLQYPDESIVPLPPLRTTLGSQAHYLKTRRVLVNFARSVDMLFVRLPFQLPSCLLGLGKPKLLQVVSNPYEVIKASSDYSGVMKVLARRFARHLEATMKRLVTEDTTRTVTNGRQMWDKLQCVNGRVTVSSCIHESEMQPRTDFRLGDPPRLLFVGYIRPEKGVDILLDAFDHIRQRRKIKLTIVGKSDRASGAEELALQRIRQSPFRDDIEVKGMLNYGSELFDLYRSHDLYVLSSLSEGTPRTLVEARGFGCPVVATNVGGIPTSVEDGKDGLLVEPSDTEQLANAIQRVLDDEVLRLSLIREGLRRSRLHTLERFTDELVEEMRILATGSGIVESVYS